jgi:hypothetical protein
MQSTFSSFKVTGVDVRPGHHQSYTLFRTKEKHTIDLKLGKEITFS